MSRTEIVNVTFQRKRVRGHIVGYSLHSEHYIVDVAAADLPKLKEVGYHYPCILVSKEGLKRG